MKEEIEDALRALNACKNVITSIKNEDNMVGRTDLELMVINLNRTIERLQNKWSEIVEQPKTDGKSCKRCGGTIIHKDGCSNSQENDYELGKSEPVYHSNLTSEVDKEELLEKIKGLSVYKKVVNDWQGVKYKPYSIEYIKLDEVIGLLNHK